MSDKVQPYTDEQMRALNNIFPPTQSRDHGAGDAVGRIKQLEGLLEEARALFWMCDPDGNRARQISAPEDRTIEPLCREIGYGAVMDSAARLWRRKDDSGALLVGTCAGLVRPWLIKANAALGSGPQPPEPSDEVEVVS